MKIAERLDLFAALLNDSRNMGTVAEGLRQESRKIMRLIIATLALCACAFAQPRLVFSGPVTTTGSPATVSIAVVGGGMAASGFQVSFAVPPGAVVIAQGPAVPAEKKLYSNITSDGIATILVIGGKTAMPDGVAATVTFPSAPFTFTPTNVVAVNAVGSAVSFVAAPYSFINPCDLNGDGLVTDLDTANVVNQVLKIAACTNGDLNADGSCTALDVQRVVNAVLGDVCKVGK